MGDGLIWRFCFSFYKNVCESTRMNLQCLMLQKLSRWYFCWWWWLLHGGSADVIWLPAVIKNAVTANGQQRYWWVWTKYSPCFRWWNVLSDEPTDCTDSTISSTAKIRHCSFQQQKHATWNQLRVKLYNYMYEMKVYEKKEGKRILWSLSR